MANPHALFAYLRWDGMKGYGCVYKGVEVKRVNGNAKRFFVCVRDQKFCNIKPNETNSNLKTLNNNIIKIILKY